MKTLICLMTLVFSMSLFAQEKQKQEKLVSSKDRPLKHRLVPEIDPNNRIFKVKDLWIRKSTLHLPGYVAVHLVTGDYSERTPYAYMSGLTGREYENLLKDLNSLKSVDDEQLVKIVIGDSKFSLELVESKADEIEKLKNKISYIELSLKILGEDQERQSVKLENSLSRVPLRVEESTVVFTGEEIATEVQ